MAKQQALVSDGAVRERREINRFVDDPGIGTAVRDQHSAEEERRS